MAKILIVDDEARIRKLVSDFLKKDGMEVIEARNGKEALEIIENETNIDLVILDVMMPEYDGWTICRTIRSFSSIPIIMLTARGEESDELFGFELGADEYISKPFSPQVLVARVQALLRRTGKSLEASYVFGDLKIDKKSHIITKGEVRLDLSPKEFALLVYFAENEGIALSREQILNAVWDYNFYGDARTVDTHVKNLRLKLGDKGDFIQTVHGVGYRFEGNI